MTDVSDAAVKVPGPVAEEPLVQNDDGDEWGEWEDEAPAPRVLPFLRVGPLEAVVENIKVVIAMMAVVLLGAVVATLVHAPTYTADTRILIGRTDVAAEALPGLNAATQQIAASYARLLETPTIRDKVEARLGTTFAALGADATATPIPESSILRITATAGDAATARRVADAASAGLGDYLATANANTTGPALLEQYTAVQQELSKQSQLLDDLTKQRDAATDPAKKAELSAKIDVAAAAKAKLQLEADTAGKRYGDSFTSTVGGDLFQVVAPASDAGSDRNAFGQKAIVIAVVLGGLLGVGVAVLKANRDAAA